MDYFIYRFRYVIYVMSCYVALRLTIHQLIKYNIISKLWSQFSCHPNTALSVNYGFVSLLRGDDGRQDEKTSCICNVYVFRPDSNLAVYCGTAFKFEGSDRILFVQHCTIWRHFHKPSVCSPGRRRAECVQNGRATRSWAQSVFGVRDVHDGACQTVLVPLQRHMTARPDTNLVSQTTFFCFPIFNGSWRQPEQEVRSFLLPPPPSQQTSCNLWTCFIRGVRGGSRRTCFSTGVAGLSAVLLLNDKQGLQGDEREGLGPKQHIRPQLCFVVFFDDESKPTGGIFVKRLPVDDSQPIQILFT